MFDPTAAAPPGMAEPDQDEFGLGQAPANDQPFMPRDKPQPDEGRRKLVEEWTQRVKDSKEHFAPDFKRMRDNMAFTEGQQWPSTVQLLPNARDDRYVANISLRHVQQRTAELYPNNPTMKAKRTEKIVAQTWDGSSMAMIQAQQQVQQSMMVGMMPPPDAMMILQDVQMVKQMDDMMDRVGKTLELFYDYNIREQTHSFKSGMKMTVRRAIITGVGYVKLGFQRAMKMRPEIEARIADMSERLANIERLMADFSDDEFQPDSAEAESLKIAVQALMAEPQLIVREGLSFNYTDSTALIPDRKCRSLKNFVGADWVAEEFILSLDEIKEVYMVDVGQSYTAYDDKGPMSGRPTSGQRNKYEAGGSKGACDEQACVWEIYNRKDGTVLIVCDGYPDFLADPAAPETETERFWPWFAFVMNEGYNEKKLFPQSDIDLVRDMQLELNRSRQGLREHRRANRPKTAVAAGMLEEADLEKLRTHPANALLELNALSPGQKIDDVLQPIKMPPIDPSVYDTSQTFEDVLRVLGSDQADQGQTGGATATEVSVAAFSQNTDTTSVVDDLNDMMTEMAVAASQILLTNVQAETVMKVVGPGAVWPQLDPQTIAENVWLEVNTGANGPPNRQQDVQMLVQIVPLLQRVPGISPEWLARELIRRMGDDLDLTDAFAEGLPSMEALNALMSRPQVQPGEPGAASDGGPRGAGKGPPRSSGPGQDPNAQGPQGAAPGGPPPGAPSAAGGMGPRPPALQYFGRNGNRPGTGGGPPSMPMSNQGFPTP